MSRHRTPVEIHTAQQRRRLVGHVIEWVPRGSLLTREGRVQAAKGRNLNVDGDWHWVPAMRDVYLLSD